MTTELTGRLRDALGAADYTYDAVAALIGTTAQAALGRNETTPGLRATTGGSPLETLTRIWLLQATVPAEAAERALPGLVDELCAAGILERSLSEVAARVDLRPYGTDGGTDGGGNLWVASDLTPGLDGGPQRVGPDHVLGISPAATSLAELTVRAPVASALDLGTGCGVQSLHLAEHVDRIVATDVNRRALWLAELNAGLNGIPTGTGAGIEIREGSFFEPVAQDRFDLIVTNPPFVISPATGERLVYRDSGLPGDRVVEHIVRTIPRHLTPGGTGQVLANWAILRDQQWDERLAGWMSPGCDAWVVQREVLDLPSYVELWLKDAGLHPSTGSGSAAEYFDRYDTWLSWFEEQQIEAVGFGWINLRASGAETPDLRLEEWRWDVEQPLSRENAAHFDRIAELRALTDAELLGSRPRLRVDVVQETFGPAGADDPSQIVLRQQTGMRRARQVDTVEAAFAGASDGDLTVGQLLAAIATILDEGPLDSRLGDVRELVADGFLELDAPRD
ncbi:methyltransferase domain-containing protein [Nocardioides marmoriginsengisoli]|uniref:Methyltransferase domain-containing protein n=1 Tax=Nocardioides marmoriginsengisoli TaxID=661483 RepID=A0A3N0CFH4_9ACTN|nr:methyltransferase [Nocardioides marmoriginsengisoli]RNL62195.1 methyltransferase domain-containing protein [Nocardioides marmoriginsengisoli]